MQTNTNVTTELRAHSRVVVDFPVQVSAGSVPPTLGRAHDLGRGGISIYAPLELRAGDIVKIGFEPQHSRMRFEVSGTIAYRNGFRYGIEFLRLAANEAAEIERIIGILALTQH